MKTSKETMREIEKLFMEYEQEVHNASKKGLLTATTARTYLLHTGNFVRWCEDDFAPGGRNAI